MGRVGVWRVELGKWVKVGGRVVGVVFIMWRVVVMGGELMG